ncbi:MAG: hypothetical protein NTV38_13145 [Chloroflexi bacterium]|nr:hypothetical protein [Chloroflexota bacterium]
MNKPGISIPERGKTLVLVLILLNTVLVAAVSALQVDANIRANQANRDSQYYAVQATGSLIQTGARSEYDLNTYSKWLTDTQEALVAEYSAMQRQAANDQQGFEALTLESQIYQARANQAKSLSVLMTDPAYAPASDQVPPDMDTYTKNLYSYSNELVQKQNDASGAYHRWNNKSDSYVAVLTVLAVAFFLLGIAQMAQPGVRFLFSSFAIVVIGISILWTLILLIF